MASIRGAGNSRHEAKDGADFFPTPLWGTRALIEHVIKPLGLYNPLHEIWEPACGGGHMVRALDEYYDDRKVLASDILDYGCGENSQFLTGCFFENWDRYNVDFVITNPPYNLFMPFFECAMRASRIGTALLVPLTVLEGKGRYEKIFKPYEGQYCVAPFVERLPIIKNRVDINATTARAYAWLVVIKNPTCALPPLLHIPPCRKQLEKVGDYD